eukprot:4752-Eustigmatos_ZCMA.PRE.1
MGSLSFASTSWRLFIPDVENIFDWCNSSEGMTALLRVCAIYRLGAMLVHDESDVYRRVQE